MTLNVSQTMVAIMTRVAMQPDGLVDHELIRDLNVMLEGTTRLELLNLLAGVASVNNQALDLLEQNTRLTKEGFLQDLGKFFAQNPE